MPSVLWRCWFGSRKSIRPVKNWVVGCWHGYLSGARCRLAYGPADATATHRLLLQYHRLQWFNHLWAHRLRMRDEQPAYTPHEVWTLYLSSHNYYDHCLHFNGRFPGGPEMSSSHLVSSATTVALQHSKVKYRIQIEQFAMYTATLLWELTCHYGITHHYLPCGRGDIPTFTPAKAGTLTSQSDALTTRPITGFCATHSKLYTIRWF